MFINPVDGHLHFYSYTFSPQKELDKYHIQVSKLFQPLTHASLEGKLGEIAKRVALAVSTPLIYLVLFYLSALEWSLKQIYISNQPTVQKPKPVDSEKNLSSDDTEVEEEDILEEEVDQKKFDDPFLMDFDLDESSPPITKLLDSKKGADTPWNAKKAVDDDLTLEEILFLINEQEKGLSKNEIKKSDSPIAPIKSLPLVDEKETISHLLPVDILNKIKKSRLDDLDAELKRLRDQTTLTSQLENSIETALLKINSSSSNRKQIKVLLGRALEIKHHLKDHYTFTHANAAPYFACSALIKELVKVFFPKRDVHSFHFLRTPQQKTTEIKDFKQILAHASNNSFINDHIGEIRVGLVSADSYFLNDQSGESALYFLGQNYSVLNQKPAAFQNIFQTILDSFIPEEASNPKLAHLATRMTNVANKISAVCGNLFVICIPKTIIEDPNKTIVYRAHPYGKPCDCHSEDKDIEILKQLQQNNLNDKSLCKGNVIPQFRLLAASLVPENGVFCFGLTALDKKTKTLIKKEAAQIASEAFALLKS